LFRFAKSPFGQHPAGVERAEGQQTFGPTVAFEPGEIPCRLRTVSSRAQTSPRPQQSDSPQHDFPAGQQWLLFGQQVSLLRQQFSPHFFGHVHTDPLLPGTHSRCDSQHAPPHGLPGLGQQRAVFSFAAQYSCSSQHVPAEPLPAAAKGTQSDSLFLQQTERAVSAQYSPS